MNIWKLLQLLLYIFLAAFVLALGAYFYNTNIIESKDSVSSAPLGTLFVDIDGEKLAYSEIDNHADTTVVFVGGLSAWHGTWQRTIDVLKQDTSRNYIALDLPPFGYSTVDFKSNFFRDTQAKRISAFLEAIKARSGFRHVILVAHSYGAGPAAEAVLQDKGGLISKFVIIDGVLNIDEQKKFISGLPFVAIDFDAVRNGLVGIALHIKPLILSRLKSFVYITDHVDQQLADLYTQSFNTHNTTKKLSLWTHDYLMDPLSVASTDSANYKKLTIPVRIIWGQEDTLTPIALTNILVSSIPNNKLYVLQGVGHIPMIENYALFDNALSNALSQ